MFWADCVVSFGHRDFVQAVFFAWKSFTSPFTDFISLCLSGFSLSFTLLGKSWWTSVTYSVLSVWVFSQHCLSCSHGCGRLHYVPHSSPLPISMPFAVWFCSSSPRVCSADPLMLGTAARFGQARNVGGNESVPVLHLYLRRHCTFCLPF